MNNIKMQQIRDKNIIGYLEEFKVATTDTLTVLFFPNLHATRRRLKKLTDYYKVLNRDRDHISQQYYYYLDKKPNQLSHRLILTNFHREIIKLNFKVVRFENEFSHFEGVRPDAFLAVELPNSKKEMYFIETERSNRPNIEKYERFFDSEEWKKLFPIFPKILWITNKNIPKTKLETICLKEDLSNIKTLIETEEKR